MCFLNDGSNNGNIFLGLKIFNVINGYKSWTHSWPLRQCFVFFDEKEFSRVLHSTILSNIEHSICSINGGIEL